MCYLVEFIFKEISIFCIWYTNDNDGFYKKNNQIIRYDNKESMLDFCRDKEIIIDEEITTYNVFELYEWSKSKCQKMELEKILNFWNIMSDFCLTINYIFIGESDEYTDLYSKIFYGNNIPAINKSNKVYVPNWSTNEINDIKKIILDGSKILMHYFSTI